MDSFDTAFAAINAFGGVDYAPHNKGVTPVFLIKPVQDFAATEKQGHAVWVDKEMVLLYVAGDSLSASSQPVDAGIIARFHDQYQAWKSKQTGAHIRGVPLAKWPMATPSLIKHLEIVNVFSVEDLASVADNNIHNIPEGRAMREKAIAWLASAKDGAASMKYASEAARLREEVAELKKIVQALGGKEPSASPAKVRAAPKRKAAKKSAWTPERRAKQAEIFRARMAARKAHPVDLPSDVEA